MNSGKPEWLAQLAPAHAPPPPGWWPLAPGWWGLALLIISAIAAIVYWQTRSSVHLRRIALREIDKLEAFSSDDKTLAEHLQNTVRRYAIGRFGREVVADLSGERWISFVVTHGGSAWAGTAGASLLRAAYGGLIETDRIAWLRGARAFIRERK